MWAILSDPRHAENYIYLGEAYSPLGRLVDTLSRRPYAGSVSAFNSLACFLITTAPGYREAEGHDRVAIDYDPERGVFTVRYFEWLSPTRNPSHQEVARHFCEWPKVAEVVDRYVLRLLLVHRANRSSADPGHD